MTHPTKVSRRQFVQTAAAATATFTIVPRHVLGGPQFVAPSEKINFAIVGCGGQGGGIGRAMGSSKLTQVVALCDVNMEDERTKRTRDQFPTVPKFQDFRVMFDKLGNEIDACSIGVPDHSHFPIAMLAMSMGKHVYVEKPLAHTFEEVELLMAAEKKYGVVCQMGNQGHSGGNYHQFKAWTEAGIIKNVTRVDGCMNKPRRWHGWKIDRYPQGGTPPETMDWDTWAGTAPQHPYSNQYDPGNWRSWFDYGNGALGDWGPHILDTTHRFLELGLPTEVEAVKLEGRNDYIFPQASTITFRFPARGDMPPCEVNWFDGKGNPPPQREELPEGKRAPLYGKVIYSDDLVFQGGTHGATLSVISPNKAKEVAASAPSYNVGSEHRNNFLLACKGEEKVRSPFDVGGPLTQVLLLGVIAQRTGGLLKFDPKTKQIANNTTANKLLNPPPREGWESFYQL
jgi:predicted dehydrogenase